MDQEEFSVNTAIIKGKRTKRHRPNGATSTESAASSDRQTNTDEEHDMANCLIMLAQGRRFPEKFTSRRFFSDSGTVSGAGGYYLYECKTCSKTFSSFQALGGHRASHKKPKTAPKDDAVAPPPPPPPPPPRDVSSSLSLQLTNRALCTTSVHANKQRVHECSICGAEFASGQALGGHMRRHRGPTAVGGSQPALTLQDEEEKKSSSSKKLSLDLDLNLPAMPDVEEVNASESKVVFSGKIPTPVFSPPQALVDCHY